MTIDDKIRDENLQYDVNRKAAKLLVLFLKKLINVNILEVKKNCLLIKGK